ncbi:hypothetical protein ACFWP7_28895 [Streptomyces sp. NPDC058470]|uniref:hypothetical protein n=1 Tax=Streptomyces sp. NPDC058470 TaxID=3346515 RepID=UPI00366A0C8E
MTMARKLTIGGLTIAAAGIVVQILGGADYPTVPPGALLLLAAAGFFALRNRWTPLIGVLIPVFIAIGAVATPNMGDQLGDTSEALTFAGTVIQLVGLAVGLICGLTVAAQSLRKGQHR